MRNLVDIIARAEEAAASTGARIQHGGDRADDNSPDARRAHLRIGTRANQNASTIRR